MKRKEYIDRLYARHIELTAKKGQLEKKINALKMENKDLQDLQDNIFMGIDLFERKQSVYFSRQR